MRYIRVCDIYCYKRMLAYITRRNSKLCGKQAEQIIIDEAVSEVTE